MRQATTIGRTDKGWVLISGPNVPFEEQRQAFNNLNIKWTEEALHEVRFQERNGVAKILLKDNASRHHAGVKLAEKKAEEKRQIAERKVEEAKKAAADKAKALADARAKEVAAKEEAKLKALELAANARVELPPAPPKK